MIVLLGQGDDIGWSWRDRIIAATVVALCVAIYLASFGAWLGSARSRNTLLALLTLFAGALVWDGTAVFLSILHLGYKISDITPSAWWNISIGIRGAVGLAVNYWYLLGPRPRKFFR